MQFAAMQFVAQLLLTVLKSYLVRLATQEFADYVIREVAHAIVKSTKTEQDDKQLAKIEAFIDGKPVK